MTRDAPATGMFEALRIDCGGDARAPSRTVEKAKAILHSRYFEPMSLERVAREVGVTPVYPTQAFRKSQGEPLYRYQTWLRLSRALVELPRCDDITETARQEAKGSRAWATASKGA